MLAAVKSDAEPTASHLPTSGFKPATRQLLELQHRCGNHWVPRELTRRSDKAITRTAGEGNLVQRQRGRPTQVITVPEEEAIVVRPRSAKNAVIDSFYELFPTKLLAIQSAFSDGLSNFSDRMRFPPDSKAEPDFQSVFLSLLGDVVKSGYEKYLKEELAAEFPGLGTAVSLVTALHVEVQRAREVSGQLTLRDFIIDTRPTFGDAIRRTVNQFIAGAARAKETAQEAWCNAGTLNDENAITGPTERVLRRSTPSANEFQQGIVSAYIRSKSGQFERGFLDYRMLGRIEVKYDEDGTFESAYVQLRTGSGSEQVADQINRLYGANIDVRQLNVPIFAGVYGPGIAGGEPITMRIFGRQILRFPPVLLATNVIDRCVAIRCGYHG